MSHCMQEGKDRIIFATKEDQDEPLQTNNVKDLVNQHDDDDDGQGLILANGDINWNCPCLGGMASGPCGVEFREAFSCFHFSEAEPKGSDCIDNFRSMQECMVRYPELYPVGEEREDMVREAEEAGQDAERDKVHHISASAAEVSHTEETDVNSEDMVDKPTARGAAETNKVTPNTQSTS